MPTAPPRTVSRRHLFRALLGRDAPSDTPQPQEPGPDIHAAGHAAYAAGDFREAIDAYRNSIRGDLSNATARVRLGHALYTTGQYIQARVEFEHVLRLTNGEDQLARLGLALTLLGMGKGERAAVALALFTDPSRPELVDAAQKMAARLTSGEVCEYAGLQMELEKMARATALLPEGETT